MTNWYLITTVPSSIQINHNAELLLKKIDMQYAFQLTEQELLKQNILHVQLKTIYIGMLYVFTFTETIN